MLCPSCPSDTATLEIGAVNVADRVEFYPQPVTLTPGKRTTPEERQVRRYAGRCIERSCINWDGHCELGRWIAEVSPQPGTPCALVVECRWFNENGPTACATCELLVHEGPVAMLISHTENTT